MTKAPTGNIDYESENNRQRQRNQKPQCRAVAAWQRLVNPSEIASRAASTAAQSAGESPADSRYPFPFSLILPSPYNVVLN